MRDEEDTRHALAQSGQRDDDNEMGWRWDFGIGRLRATDQTEAVPTERLLNALPLSSTHRRTS
jgi:hypothetical protein